MNPVEEKDITAIERSTQERGRQSEENSSTLIRLLLKRNVFEFHGISNPATSEEKAEQKVEKKASFGQQNLYLGECRLMP